VDSGEQRRREAESRGAEGREAEKGRESRDVEI
jgi:hypothetical protein